MVLRISLLPAEIIVLSGLLAFALLRILGGFPPIMLDVQGGLVLKQFAGTSNYLVFLLVAGLVYLVGLYARKVLFRQPAMRTGIRQTLDFIRLTLSLALSMYLMLVFKWWSHLRGVTYDKLYYAADQAIGGYGWIDALAAGLAFDHQLYFRLFAVSFLLVYLTAAILKVEVLKQVIAANAAVAVLGGLAYMIAPAYGPFIISSVPGALYETQQVMLQMTQAFRDAGGAIPPHFQIEAALGAMPSLHVAHILVMQRYGLRLNRWLGMALLPLTLFIGIYAVATRFHYIVDIFAGALLAALAIAWVEYLAGRGMRFFPSRSEKHKAHAKAGQSA